MEEDSLRIWNAHTKCQRDMLQFLGEFRGKALYSFLAHFFSGSSISRELSK